MPMKDLISVIVPVYNVERYLPLCIDSILSQTYERLEVILVDDGSPDRCAEICDEYAKKDARVRVIHKKNGGLSSARNAGLEVAGGEFIAFVDSDDTIAPELYERLRASLGDARDAIANAMYVYTFDDGTTAPSVVPHSTDESFPSIQLLQEMLMHTGDVSVCTKLFPRGVLDGIGFDEGVLNEDFLFMIKVIEKIKEIRFVGYVGYYYYSRAGSITKGYSRATEDMQKNSLYTLTYVKRRYPELTPRAVRFALYQNMAYLLLVPRRLATGKNEVYSSAMRFIRTHFFSVLFNKYLRTKQRIILFGLMLAPRAFAKKYQKKHGI